MKSETPILQLFNESDEDIPLSNETASAILDQISLHEEASFSMVELVYVNEEEIVRINKEHLDRDYITDIISFRYDDGTASNSDIEGTLFCCAPRIIEQAEEFGESVENEFKRILIHGLLHLLGYKDKTKEQKSEMTSLENKYLQLTAPNK